MLLQYPDLFPVEELTQELFYFAYQSVMTRIYGSEYLPQTSMIPFSDMFNHMSEVDNVTHYVVQKEVELLGDPAQIPKKYQHYKVKKNKLNLQIINQGETLVDKDSAAQLYRYSNPKINYIMKHKKLIKSAYAEEAALTEKLIHHREISREIVHDINFKRVVTDTGLQVWDLKYYSSESSEDNDTDEELDQFKSGLIKKLKKNELKRLRSTQKLIDIYKKQIVDA